MTFVTVCYGDNHRVLFNPNCQTRLFMENVKKRCECPGETEIDLSDEHGNLKNITLLPSKYAKQILNIDRENLVLIQIQRKKSEEAIADDDVTYIPLLNNDDVINSKFKARLLNRDPDSFRPDSRTKRTPRDKRGDKATRRSAESDKREEWNASSGLPSQKRNGNVKTKTLNRSKSKGKNK